MAVTLQCTKGDPYRGWPLASAARRSDSDSCTTGRGEVGEGSAGSGRAQVRHRGARAQGCATRRARTPDSCGRAAGSWELKLVMLLLRRKASLPMPHAGDTTQGAHTPNPVL